jgi:circadian clock protein KaiC
VTPVDLTPTPPTDRVSTGVRGLDEILGGGLPRGHVYLVEGESGAGKTTLGLQFLIDGRHQGGVALWITLSETERELRQIAASHGWSLDGIRICAPLASGRPFDRDEHYSFFSPADVELDQIRQTIMQVVDEVRPSHVVVDPFSDIRHLARDVLRYRREVLALREYFTTRECTVLLMQEMTRGTPGDLQAEALVHGYLTLHQDSPEYGGQRRRLRVHKMRGIPFRDGYHDVAIRTGGMMVYPRLIAADHVSAASEEQLLSGVPQLDALLGGGIERGTSMLIMGPAGVGKSTMTTHYAVSAAAAGHHGAVFVFDETVRTLRARGEKLGLPVGRHIESGLLEVEQIDSAEYSAGRFTHRVMQAVDEGARLVVIDSLSGYVNAMPEERFLATHLHELLTYLGHRNVVTMMTLAQHGVVGEQVSSPVDISYLADTVLLLRYFEAAGAIRRAISVVKKRSGPHEVYVRELSIGASGLRIGEPLRQFQGVLTGLPTFSGDAADLAEHE